MQQRFQVQNVMSMCVGYFYMFRVLCSLIFDVFLFPQGARSDNIEIILELIRELNDLAVLITISIVLSQHVLQYIQENRLYLVQFLFFPCFRSREQRQLAARNEERDAILNNNRRYLRDIGIVYNRHDGQQTVVRTLEDDDRILQFEFLQYGIDTVNNTLMELQNLTQYDGLNIHERFRRPVYELDLQKVAKDRKLVEVLN